MTDAQIEHILLGRYAVYRFEQTAKVHRTQSGICGKLFYGKGGIGDMLGKIFRRVTDRKIKAGFFLICKAAEDIIQNADCFGTMMLFSLQCTDSLVILPIGFCILNRRDNKILCAQICVKID